ncbi:MAG: hypothetical protein PHG66_05850 [Candidatus Colwellbacteria bacterium]|nr:hypothetical protein [Candidatus Colwellbacteria bacterium]
MWVFTKEGFFSAVQHRNDPTKVVVRTRFADDLYKVFPGLSNQIKYTPEADYPYRITLPKSTWALYLDTRAYDIDYTNFKASLTDDARHDCYLKIWRVLRDEQLRIERENRKPAPKTKKYPIVKRKPKTKK